MKWDRITPLHKGGDLLDPNSHRPISIICSIAKVFEKLIYNKLSEFLNINNILSSSQSGFRPNHSITTALYSVADNGEIFIDLTKAFDVVDRCMLSDKLHAIGLSENAIL